MNFQWWDDYAQAWTPYDTASQVALRAHVAAHPLNNNDFSTIPDYELVVPQYGTYTINFVRLVQINKVTRFERQVRILDAAHRVLAPQGLREEEDVDDADVDDDVDYEEEEKDIFVPVDTLTLNDTDQCVLCFEPFDKNDEVVIPRNCTGHFFHKKCPHFDTTIVAYMEKTKQCPVCKKRYGIVTGHMPRGRMDVDILDMKLPGYEAYKTIQITFTFPGGRQGENHPNPGARYESDQRFAYLPDCEEGQHVLKLLRKAWNRKLLFAIGTSVTRQQDNVIIYNGIHFKSVPYATPSEPWGWPDPTYLHRVVQELNEKGVY